MLCKWGGVEFVNLDANVSVAINYEIARGKGGGGQNWPNSRSLRNPSAQAAKQLSNVLMNRRTDASNRYINLAEQQPQQLLCNLSDLESLTNCTAAATIMCVVNHSIYIKYIYIHVYIVCVFNLGISLASFRKSPKTSWPPDFEIPLRKQLADKAGSQSRDSPAQQTIQ